MFVCVCVCASPEVECPSPPFQVKLVYDGHNRYDFHAVDLWTRPVVEGSPSSSQKVLLVAANVWFGFTNE